MKVESGTREPIRPFATIDSLSHRPEPGAHVPAYLAILERHTKAPYRGRRSKTPGFGKDALVIHNTPLSTMWKLPGSPRRDSSIAELVRRDSSGGRLDGYGWREGCCLSRGARPTAGPIKSFDGKPSLVRPALTEASPSHAGRCGSTSMPESGKRAVQ